MKEIALFIFRRDFRLYDNTTFIELVKRANEQKLSILPCFIFNSFQIDQENNKYFSNNCVQFMVQSLCDLEKQIAHEGGTLHYFYSNTTEEILELLHTRYNIKLVGYNKDITPFAKQRDEKIRYWCDREGITTLELEDYTLHPLEKVKTNQGKYYEIYTPFYRRAIRISVEEPHTFPKIKTDFIGQLEKDKYVLDPTKMNSFFIFNEKVEQKGGREQGLLILDKLKRAGFKNYKNLRDYPSKNATTKLSAYLKFGCLSFREVYKITKESLGKDSALIGELYFREFYYYLAYHYPEILKGQIDGHNIPVHGRYEKQTWKGTEEQFELWKQGKTGFPIVDAGMRCLNETGWLHNRGRMIVAMFLVRDLDIDWRKGEEYFAKQLVDYDPALNSCGWTWCLSYRRKFNPYKQAGKYDKDFEWVKKWVPELQDVSSIDLVTWWENYTKYPNIDYPPPMIEIQGYRVKFQNYIKDYVRPKNPDYQKPKKKSKYPPGTKNKSKYEKNKSNT